MGLSKVELFTDEQNYLANMAKALAHPARIAILQQLMENGQCICGDLVHKLPLSQATISQHLKALKQAGIIKGIINGKFRCYCIDSKCCSGLSASFMKLFKSMSSCC